MALLTDDDRPAPPTPRRVSRGLLWAAALATVVLAIAVVVSFTFEDDSGVAKLSLNDPESPLDAGQSAHDLPGESIPPLSFARYDPATRTFSSSAGSLVDYKGAPLVINFWASNCGPCIREMPAMQSVADEYEDRVAFVGIAPKSDDEANGIELIDQTGVTYDLGRDDGDSMIEWFGVPGLPTTIFVQADGTIADVQTGELSAADIEKILSEKLGV